MSTEFISEKIPIKGTPCSFQVASVKKKWAMRVIDNNKNKVIKVAKLKKVTSAVITDKIRDIVGKKFNLKEHPIDEMDLGSKMAILLKQVDNFKKTGALPQVAKPAVKPKAALKLSRKPDSFWSAYSTAVTKPVDLASEPPTQPKSTSQTAPEDSAISLGSATTNVPPQQTTAPQPTSNLDETLSILGVNCPNCGKEVDYDAEVCPHCGAKLD